MPDTILESIDQRVAVLTMNRPHRKNAFTTEMYDELDATMRRCQANRDVGAVVVTGAGDAFSAGQDLGEMASLAGSDGEGVTHGFPRFMDTLCQFDKPLLAAVNGVGVGLGFTMLLHCDLVYVSTQARLKLPFLTLGVVPEAASSYLLPVVVGWQRAAQILYTTDWVDAESAVRWGIATQMYQPAELLPAAIAMAHRIAAQPPAATRHTKRVLLATRNDLIRAARAREDAAFAERVGSPENMEALMAFLQKRPPDFSNLPE